MILMRPKDIVQELKEVILYSRASCIHIATPCDEELHPLQMDGMCKPHMVRLGSLVPFQMRVDGAPHLGQVVKQVLQWGSITGMKQVLGHI